MKRVGLTGGIGSGKSTVARIFQSLGVPVYFADDRGKHLLVHDVDLKEAIVERFGEEILQDNEIHRPALASIVFSDSASLSDLNALIHPAVNRDYRAWCEASESDIPYTLKEAAILFETGGHRQMDAVILVTAPEEMRIERVMKRDDVSKEAVLSRIARQWSEEDKIPLADYLILNDGEHSLIEQVITLHKELIES